jgi:hypothetical protein
MVRVGRRYLPADRDRATYDRQFALYNELYAALAPIYRRWTGGAQ